MSDQRYISPFRSSSGEDWEQGPSAIPDGNGDRFKQDDDVMGDYLLAGENIGFKPAQEWDGMTEAQRREKYKGFLYPSWYPFAACEGNYGGSPHFDNSWKRAPAKSGESEESLEARKKQFSVPMQNKQTYMRNPSPKIMTRSPAS